MDSESYGNQKYFYLFALDLHVGIATDGIKERLYIESLSKQKIIVKLS